MTDILKNINHIYFTGIGGIGMSGIAEILLESGESEENKDAESPCKPVLIGSDGTVYWK
jgi:UDP-N-acetylmuramate-alanine ligase